MDNRQMLAGLLSCGPLDVDFLTDIMDKHGLTMCDLLDNIEDSLDDASATVNDLIYASYYRIAEAFLEHIVKHRKALFVNSDYNIFTNYLDSHVWFESANLNRWFEAWRERLE